MEISKINENFSHENDINKDKYIWDDPYDGFVDFFREDIMKSEGLEKGLDFNEAKLLAYIVHNPNRTSKQILWEPYGYFQKEFPKKGTTQKILKSLLERKIVKRVPHLEGNMNQYLYYL